VGLVHQINTHEQLTTGNRQLILVRDEGTPSPVNRSADEQTGSAPKENVTWLVTKTQYAAFAVARA
jgi:hypothetical protein